MTETDTTWITPGTKVVTYRPENAGGYAEISTAIIARVNKASFTLDNGDRYRLDTQRRPSGSTWRADYRCVPADSHDAREAAAWARARAAEFKAEQAYDAWRKNRTPADRLAAIAAFEAIEDGA